MTPFTCDGPSQRERVLGLLLGHDVDDVISYEALSEVIGKDIRKDRSALYAAVGNLEQEHHRTVEAVPNVGYRIVRAEEHYRLANGHHRRARRQLTRTRRKLSSADRTALTAEQAARLDALEENVRRQQSAIRFLERRMTENERRMAETPTRSELRAEVRKLEQLIDRVSRR